jgi:epsilon-lactone hydrolase
MNSTFKVMLLILYMVSVSAHGVQEIKETDTKNKPRVDEVDTIHVPAFDLPISGFLSAESRQIPILQKKEHESWAKQCPYTAGKDEDVAANRLCAEKYYYPPTLERFHARYKVKIVPKTIAGVYTEVIMPATGVSEDNQHRVLINLHGGSFKYGARWGGQVESIPIAALGKIKVISVDYRMAPEHTFPAASEDVAAVYHALLKDYSPENIGIYGCSAGGRLTAQSIAWFQQKGLPMPGAVGMFCAAAADSRNGDSHYIASSIRGKTLPGLEYLENVDPNDPLAYPINSSAVMAEFPPALLISSTRDFAFSSVVATNSKLVKLGVETELHIWEGLTHAFLLDSRYPESREAYDVIARFFNKHLGK